MRKMISFLGYPVKKKRGKNFVGEKPLVVKYTTDS